jgi:hypothetical protein
MLVAALVVLGLFSYRKLGVDLFPNIDFPIITVTTTLKGAGVEEMETSVTKVLEEAINAVDGIDTLQSTTREGVSNIVVSFVLEKSREIAAQDVRDKVRGLSAPPRRDALSSTSSTSAVPVRHRVSGTRSLREVTELGAGRRRCARTLPGVGRKISSWRPRHAISVDPRPARRAGLSSRPECAPPSKAPYQAAEVGSPDPANCRCAPSAASSVWPFLISSRHASATIRCACGHRHAGGTSRSAGMRRDSTAGTVQRWCGSSPAPTRWR